MEGLRGHTSGYAVPTYVIDAPGGGGKIPVMPNYLISYCDHKVVLRNYEGYITTYEEPETYQKHDSHDLRATASTSARSPASPASSACSRASACGSSRAASRRSTPAATPRRTGSRIRPSGCRSGSAPSRGRRRGAPGPRGRRRCRARLRARRGAPSARGRADRVGPRGAALGLPLAARRGPARGSRHLHIRRAHVSDRQTDGSPGGTDCRRRCRPVVGLDVAGQVPAVNDRVHGSWLDVSRAVRETVGSRTSQAQSARRFGLGARHAQVIDRPERTGRVAADRLERRSGPVEPPDGIAGEQVPPGGRPAAAWEVASDPGSCRRPCPRCRGRHR